MKTVMMMVMALLTGVCHAQSGKINVNSLGITQID